MMMRLNGSSGKGTNRFESPGPRPMNILRIATVLTIVLLLFFLPDPDQDYLFERSLDQLLERPASAIEAAGTVTITVHVEGARSTSLKDRAASILADKAGDPGRIIPRGGTPMDITLEADTGAPSIRWSIGGSQEERETAPRIDWKALLPPLIAIVTALLFQKTILALSLGVWLGATIQSGGNPLTGLWMFFRTYVIQQALMDTFRIEIIGFVIGLVALVGVISKGGGVQGMMEKITGLVKSARSALISTFLMGLVIFFDDYANTILVGNTMRPLTDKMRIAREKLAYIVDSTAAPVAGISMLSTWVAYEISLFSEQLVEVGISDNPYFIFAKTIPFRFYSLFTLVFILSGILLRRDFGPMLTAERRARTTGALSRPGARPMVSDAMTRVQSKKGIPFRWLNGFLPLATVIAVTLFTMWQSGNQALAEPYAISGLFSLTAIRDVMALASSTKAIALGAWSGFFLAVFLMLSQKLLSVREVAAAAFSSTRALFFAVVILILAWCIGGVCNDMGTAYYLVALFKQAISPLAYPIVLFAVSCLVSFSTGSSWSTMAIILPNAVILAHLLGADGPIGAFGLTIVSIGAVLEGSIFGDHCSPLSDTTILSSVSSAADHIDHVKTQIPYALTTMIVAVVCGYIPATHGFPAPLSLLFGTIVIVLVIRVFGRPPGEIVEQK